MSSTLVSRPSPLSISSLRLHGLSIGLICLYLWPYWLQGQDAHLLVHDQLDSVLLSLKVLAESGQLFAHPDTVIPAIGDGILRASYPSPFFVIVWLFNLFGPFEGFVLNQFLIRVLAYWGMYRLLTTHVMKTEGERVPAALAALLFASLPHYSLFGLSIAGQPLFFSALLNIRARVDRRMDWALCALFPAYSMLPLGGAFVLAAGGLLCLVDLATRHPARWRVLGVLSLTAGVVLVVEYQTLMVMMGLANGFRSHRVEFKIAPPASVLTAIWENFRYGQYHAQSLHQRLILPMVLIAVLYWGPWRGMAGATRQPVATSLTAICAALLAAMLLIGKLLSPAVLGALVVLLTVNAIALSCVMYGTNSPRAVQCLFWALGITAGISVWYGLWPMLWELISQWAPQAPYVNLSRFHYLHPFTWGMAFAAVLCLMWSHAPRLGRTLTLMLFALQAVIVIHHAEARQSRKAGDPSFRAFFAPDLFDELKQEMAPGESPNAVISLGLDPAVAAYNGLHTLDGYLANYPLRYKQAFRQVIAPELERSPSYSAYFDQWGSRFFLTTESIQRPQGVPYLQRQVVDAQQMRAKDLRLDTKAFRALGGRYLISALPVDNAADLGLMPVSVHERADAAWRLHLYRLSPEPLSPRNPAP
jgi:hypothetical protein